MTHGGQPATGPARSAGERLATILCSVLTLVAAAGVVLVATLTSSSASPTAIGPGVSTGGADSSGGADTTGVPNSSGTTGPSTSGSFDVAKFRATFPLPPGATRTKLPLDNVPGNRAYIVTASLTSVKAFYDKQLPALGVSWQPLTTTEVDTGRIVGWHGSMDAPNAKRMEASLSLDENYLGSNPGTVTIQVTINTY